MALGRRLLDMAGVELAANRRDALRAMARPRAALRRAGYPAAPSSSASSATRSPPATRVAPAWR
jgi:hypothetical protein